MKRLIPILLLLLLIGACEKKTCYYCKTETFSKYDDHRISIDSEIICELNELEILDYQTDRFNFAKIYGKRSAERRKQKADGNS